MSYCSAVVPWSTVHDIGQESAQIILITNDTTIWKTPLGDLAVLIISILHQLAATIIEIGEAAVVIIGERFGTLIRIGDAVDYCRWHPN